MKALPEKIEKQVVAALFSDAEINRWVYCNPRERSQQYAAWLADPRIGGALTAFMTLDEARVWIKDGPMKEFSRARNGLGKYSSLITARAPDPQTLVQMALGEGWRIVSSSQQIKPLRIKVLKDKETVTFVWGPVKDLKHLVWAALNGTASVPNHRWILCVISPFVAPVPKDLKLHNQRIAALCGFELIHLSIQDGG